MLLQSVLSRPLTVSSWFYAFHPQLAQRGTIFSFDPQGDLPTEFVDQHKSSASLEKYDFSYSVAASNFKVCGIFYTDSEGLIKLRGGGYWDLLRASLDSSLSARRHPRGPFADAGYANHKLSRKAKPTGRRQKLSVVPKAQH